MKERKKPETLRLRALAPTFVASDLEASLRWYCEVLGFVVDETFRDSRGRVVAASLVAGATKLFLQAARGRVRQPKGEACRLWCVTAQDIEELAEAVKARGGVLAQELQERAWGTRDFAVVDPDGFTLSISTPMR